MVRTLQPRQQPMTRSSSTIRGRLARTCSHSRRPRRRVMPRRAAVSRRKHSSRTRMAVQMLAHTLCVVCMHLLLSE